MRLAYADPPYPGKAHLYPENEEVDHAELIARLCEYDGWALSTDEGNLAGVLALCPPRTRVLAWCRGNAYPGRRNPSRSWEPVLMRPARERGVSLVRSFFVSGAPTGRAQRNGITGQKTAGFAEWVFGCLGAIPGDTLDDLFPGTGVIGDTWKWWEAQLRIPVAPDMKRMSYRRRANIARLTHDPLV